MNVYYRMLVFVAVGILSFIALPQQPKPTPKPVPTPGPKPPDAEVDFEKLPPLAEQMPFGVYRNAKIVNGRGPIVMDVKMPDGKVWERIMLGGVMAPWLKIQAMKESGEYMRQTLENRPLTLFVVGRNARRLPVVRVELNGDDVGLQAIKLGMLAYDEGSVYHLPAPYRIAYREEDQLARRERRGFWGWAEVPFNEPRRFPFSQDESPMLPTRSTFPKAEAVKVLAGDKLAVVLPDKRRFRLQIAGVASPHLLEAGGRDAQGALGDFTVAQMLVIVSYQTCEGWTCASVTVNDLDAGAALLQKGWARYDPKTAVYLNEARRAMYQRLEAQAKFAHAGIWQ